MAYGDLIDLTRRITADKVLCDKAFCIANNKKYGGYQRGLASTVYTFFHKKNLEHLKGRLENEIMSVKDLTEELQKPIITTFKKREVYSSFIKVVNFTTDK